MFFGLTIEKLVVIGVVAALVIGPERLPRYAETLARLTGQARDYLRGARTRVRDEMGPEFDEVDWRRLDPRQYDPRRIIREALLDDAPTASVKAVSMSSATMAAAGDRVKAAPLAAGELPPFDSEAT